MLESNVLLQICGDFMKLQLMDPDVLSLSVIKLADVILILIRLILIFSRKRCKICIFQIVCDNIVGYARYLYRCVVHRMSGTTKVQVLK